MAPQYDDDNWSDSDDEGTSDVKTSVLLGVPDGPVDTPSDILDAAVSRIGGHPAFLPSAQPPFTSSQCKVCSNTMELLVQMWCPFEDSPMDRALYIWGCASSGCQAQPGSIRAWRGLRYNERYAAKLAAKSARAKEKSKAREGNAVTSAVGKANPFTMSVSAGPNPFGLGDQIFAGNSDGSTADDDAEGNGELSDAESTVSSSEESLVTAMASASIEESFWKAAPAYPPLYLSTIGEYLPPQPKAKLPPGVRVSDPLADDPGGKNDKDISWAMEPYENSLDVDHVFERFAKRVGFEGEQCVRYDLNGTPLPFSSDKVFETLFPAPPSDLLPVTKADFKVVQTPKRAFDLSAVPSCLHCNSKRVFECQLMPNLINVLKQTASGKPMSEEERKEVLEAALKGGSSKGKGMEWGTCLVFSCEMDCRVEAGSSEELKDVWREEVVMIQGDI